MLKIKDLGITNPTAVRTNLKDCCPTDSESNCSERGTEAVGLPDEAVAQLRQQLRQHIN